MLTKLYSRLCGQKDNIIGGCGVIGAFFLAVYFAYADSKVGNESRIFENTRRVNEIRKIVLDVLIDKKLITN